MRRLRPDVDIVLDILKAVATANPGNSFAQSILHQYQEKGGLSKKQLQGLLGKAGKIPEIPASKLATLEAIILKKGEKTRSALPEPAPLFRKDPEAGALIRDILSRYPGHKRVLFLRSKYENNEPLTPAEMADLQRFSKILR